MTIVNFRYKGSSTSGYHGHAGRPGKLGGSAPTSFRYPVMGAGAPIPSDQIRIGGKTGLEWAKEQASISKTNSDNLRQQLANQNIEQKDVDAFLDRLNQHRAVTLSETLQTSRGYYLSSAEQKELMDNVLHHDVDKYDPKTAIPYITRHDISGKLTREFWEAQSSHANDNPHHPEYWIIPGTDRANQMPTTAFVEMVGDWKATAKYFGDPQDDYYRKNGRGMTLHPNTREAIERELGIRHTPFPDKFPREFHKELTIQFRYKGSSTSGNYMHAGRPGKVGGSAPKSSGVFELSSRSPNQWRDVISLLPDYAKVRFVTAETEQMNSTTYDMSKQDAINVLGIINPTQTTGWTIEIPDIPEPPVRDEAPIVRAGYDNVEDMPFYKNLSDESKEDSFVFPGDDPITTAIFHAQGFDGKPDVVDLKQMQGYAAAGEKVIYRGVSGNDKAHSNQYVEEFRTNGLYVGAGISGQGTYVATEPGIALDYARSGGTVMTMTIRKDARLIHRDDLSKMMQKERDDADKAALNAGDSLHDDYAAGKITQAQLQKSLYEARKQSRLVRTRVDMRDEGRYAAAHGYDVITDAKSLDDARILIILNRTALRVLNVNDTDIQGNKIGY